MERVLEMGMRKTGTSIVYNKHSPINYYLSAAAVAVAQGDGGTHVPRG
jgi:hypothetical protein